MEASWESQQSVFRLGNRAILWRTVGETPMLPAAAARKPRRARHVLGIELPRGDDGRTQYAKRFRALVASFAANLGGDLSAADQALIKQAAHLVLTSEQLQAASVSSENVAIDDIVRANSEARRAIGILEAKGAKAKPAGPTLAEHLAAKYAQNAADEPESIIDQ